MNQNFTTYYPQQSSGQRSVSPPPFNPDSMTTQNCYYCQRFVDMKGNIYIICTFCRTIMHDNCALSNKHNGILCPKCGGDCFRNMILPTQITTISPPAYSTTVMPKERFIATPGSPPIYSTAITMPPTIQQSYSNYGTTGITIHHKNHHDLHHEHHHDYYHHTNHTTCCDLCGCRRCLVSFGCCCLFLLFAIIAIIILFLTGVL